MQGKRHGQKRSVAESEKCFMEHMQHTWPNPQGACVDVSPWRSRRSAKTSLQVNQPSREPGAMVFENESRRITRPW